jgi:DNA-binding MarR family transcriptional regulator
MTENRMLISNSSGEDAKDPFVFQRCLEDIVGILEYVDPEMPLQRFKTLIHVSMNPGITTRELAKRTGMSDQSASRNLLALGELNPMTKRQGYCLIEAHDNFADRRGRRYSLAPRGKDLLEKLQNVFSVHVNICCRPE